MSNFTDVMRRMRRYTAAVNKLYNDRASKINKLNNDGYEGSTFYTNEVEKIDQQTEASRINLTTAAKNDMTKIFEEMRKNVGDKITKAPTADIANTLNILGQLENISPIEIKLYAGQMIDCPLAMKRLQEIARRHNIIIHIPDIDEMTRALDVFESNIALFLEGYHGRIDDASFSIRQLYQYFQDDNTYVNNDGKTTIDANTAFWENIIGIGDPSMFDNTSSEKAIDIQLFFGDMEAMLSYIRKQTEGLTETEKENKVNDILKSCPDQYGAVYRYYLSEGKMLPLNVVM